MAHALWIAVAAMSAALPQPAGGSGGAPPEAPGARYCLRVDPIIGTRIETIQCRTRADWVDLGLDVDQEWAQNGVGVIA
jgi:hypothetical protein